MNDEQQVTTVRLRNGEGPEVTVPDWADATRPEPDQWLDWFLVQSREAQVSIIEYHLECEAYAVARGWMEDDDAQG